MKQIPALYHPTTIALLDDDIDFLNSLSLTLYDHFKCKIFTSPELAKQFLINNNTWQAALKSKYLKVDYQDFCKFSVDVEIDNIHQEIFKFNRFEKAGILILDYDMPSINGLEIARALRSRMPIKIIMLTGEADQETAVEAFNNKEIDRFLLKSDPDYNEKLVRYINQLQQDYFNEFSISMLDPLYNQNLHPFHDVDYCKLFHKILMKHRIIEYYLIDESGSFLMLNAEGKPIWLIARTQVDMELFYDMATAESEISEDVLKSLENKTTIVFLPKPSAIVPPFKDWVMHNATQLRDKEIYYCILQGWQSSDECFEQVSSYQSFLQND